MEYFAVVFFSFFLIFGNNVISFFCRFNIIHIITQAVRTKMCSVMVFAVVDKADTIVMNDREELDR